MKCNTGKLTYSEGPTYRKKEKGLLSLHDIACSFILNNNASDSFWHFGSSIFILQALTLQLIYDLQFISSQII